MLTRAAAVLALAALSTGSANAQSFSDTIQTYDKAVAASSMAEDWLDGKLPVAEISYDGPPIKFRYSSYLPEVSAIEKINIRALEQLERESGGKIEIETYFAQSLHPQREGFSAVRDGIADYAACFGLYESSSFEILHGVSLPAMFTDASTATMTYMSLYPKYFKPEYENLDVYLARGMVTTPYNIMGNHKYETLDDFEGSKIRIGGRTGIKTITALGAVPVNVPSSEAYVSLQRGLVDGVAFNDPVFPVFKLPEVSKYHNDFSLLSGNLEWCTSEEWFDALPADLKDVFYNWTQRLNMVMAQVYYERDSRRVQEEFEKAGLELVSPTDEVRAGWKAAVAPIVDEWIAEQDAAGRPGSEFVADLRKTRDEFAKMSWNEQFEMVFNNPVIGVIDY